MPQTVTAVTDIAKRGYARPDVLVSTDWVEEHRNDPKVRLVESNEDVLLYETGHIPGAVKVDWVTDLNDPLVRDYVGRERFERLLRAKGINNDTTIVFYGDKNNWWATYAFWVFRLFGLENLKILDGGPLGGRGSRARHDGSPVSGRQHQGARARRLGDSRVPPGGRAARQAAWEAGGCAQP